MRILKPACQPRIVSDEAHLSAEKAQAREDAWIPGSNANASREAHDQAPSDQGPQASDRLVERHARSPSRPRRPRLSRSADFDRVFRHGRSQASRELVLYVFPREADEGRRSRVGLSVSRRVGGAVQRNRIKRLLREAFAIEGERLPSGSDAVIVARRDARELAEREGLAGIQRSLAALIDRVVGAETSERPESQP